MRNRYLERGSHVVIAIVIVLSVAVVVLLGLVFWQNFVNKPADDTSTSAPVSTSDVDTDSTLSSTAELALQGYTTTLNYPESWEFEGGELDELGDGESGRQSRNGTITSPDGQVVINYNLFNPGDVGGTCGGDAVTVTSHEWNALDNVNDVLFAAYIFNYEDGDSYYTFGAINDSEEVRSLEVGSNDCGLFMWDSWIVLDNDTVVEDYTLVLTAYVTFKELGETEPVSASTESIKDAFDSDDAKIAKSIIESLKIEQE